ncbi:MAG: ParA family protein [Candidatus Marinimicrobia bacterium]|nr:ParA family protein [Candidatus Neomarinimicrobiota bacterium]
MRSIAILNQKGGSGKTTTSVNLASTLGEKGRRVLVVDMDPQASATDWFGIDKPGRGITDIFVDDVSLLNLVRATDVLGVAIIPASAWLLGAEKVLRWDPPSLQVFKKAKRFLPSNQWDYMLIDCPPALNLLTANALVGADYVLIPVEAHRMALPGVERVIASVETLRRNLNSKLSVLMIVPCRVDSRTRHSRDVVDELRSRYGKLVSTAEIRENIKLAEAPAHSMPITIFDGRGKGAIDYRALADEIIATEKRIIS